MDRLILSGSPSAREEYISKFIKENKILPYHIKTFIEPLKISDAREIKRMLGLKIDDKQKRLFIIEQEPTIEAQNALLKTLEELSEESCIIFCSPNLLPTVVSRCRTVNLGARKIEPKKEQVDQIMSLISGLVEKRELHAILLFSDKWFQNDNIEDLQICARFALLRAISSRDYQKIKFSYKLFRTLLPPFSLISSNNLNKRIAIEKALIEEFYHS